MVRRDGAGEFSIGYDIVELNVPELLVLRSDPMPELGMHEPTVTRVELHDHGANWAASFDRLAAFIASV
jgi:hypothetical protein